MARPVLMGERNWSIGVVRLAAGQSLTPPRPNVAMPTLAG